MRQLHLLPRHEEVRRTGTHEEGLYHATVSGGEASSIRVGRVCSVYTRGDVQLTFDPSHRFKLYNQLIKRCLKVF